MSDRITLYFKRDDKDTLHPVHLSKIGKIIEAYNKGYINSSECLKYDDVILDKKNSWSFYGIKNNSVIEVEPSKNLDTIYTNNKFDDDDDKVIYSTSSGIIEGTKLPRNDPNAVFPVSFPDLGVDPDKRKPTPIGVFWRKIARGLNLYGNCKNKKCEAYKDIVIQRKRFGEFDIVRDVQNINCPVCGSIFSPIKCGFYKCNYKVEGALIDDDGNVENGIKLEKTTTDDMIDYYGEGNEQKTWIKLKITVTGI